MAAGCAVLVLLQRWLLLSPIPLLLLASVGLALHRQPTPTPTRLLESRPVELVGRLIDTQQAEDRSWALFDRLQDTDGAALAPASAHLFASRQDPKRLGALGTHFLLEGRLAHDGKGFQLEDFRATPKWVGRAPPLAWLRHQVQDRLHHQLRPAAAGMASALLLGERRDLPPLLREQYRRFGLVHLLAVSGLHFWVWDRLLRRILPHPLRGLRWPSLVLAGILASGSAPVLRALTMLLLRDWSALAAWRVTGIQLWALAWVAEVTLWNPRPSGLGFVLSYSVTAALILGTRQGSSISIVQALRASWLAFLAGAPALHAVQGTIAPWTILLSPLLALILPFRLVASALALTPGLGAVCDALLNILEAMERGLLTHLQSLPASPWVCPSWSSAWFTLSAWTVLLATRTRGWKRRMAVGSGVVVFLALMVTQAGTPSLVALPVGHGLAVVVAGERQSLGFDLGSGDLPPKRLVDSLLLPTLRRLQLPAPRTLVRSHDDIDHVNGWPAYAERVDFRELQVAPGGRMEVPGLHPWKVTVHGSLPSRAGSSNDAGHVLELECDGFRAVLLGDQSGFSLRQLLHRLEGGPIDLLMLPHHGLTLDGLAELILHLCPEQAWSSSGPRNFPLPVAPLLANLGVPWESTLEGPLVWRMR